MAGADGTHAARLACGQDTLRLTVRVNRQAFQASLVAGSAEVPGNLSVRACGCPRRSPSAF
jgi:hypothetical protein